MKKCWFSNLVDIYHGVIKEAAKNLLDDTTSVETIMYRLAEDRLCFKNAAARVTGTAAGWTQVPYELLTIEFLKHGLRNSIDQDDWEMIDDDRHGWKATYAEKPLEILPQVSMKQLLRETKNKIQLKYKRTPDVVVRIGKRIIALIEIKSSFGRPGGLPKTVLRLLDFEKALGGRNPQRVSAIVNYGVTWGGGKETVSEVPANFLFVSTSEHKLNAREILNVKVRDITDLIERVDRQIR